jgi:hypothetical protein
MPRMTSRKFESCLRASQSGIAAVCLGLVLCVSTQAHAELGAPEEECPKGLSFSGKAPPADAERGCVDGAGQRQGPWTQWWPNGAKWREEAYKDGKQHGRSTAWRPDGGKLYEAEYKSGFLNGSITVYHANGQKKVEGAYTFGKPNGRWVAYTEDGKEVGQLLFDAGKVRPRSKGNPKVVDYMPKRLHADALSTARSKAQTMHEVGRKLIREGRSPAPAKLKGDKAAEFAKQSKWLVETGQKLELHARAIEILSANAASPVQIGLSEEAELAVGSLLAAIDAAKKAAKQFQGTSASTNLRHSLAQTALRKLEQ